MFYVVAVPAVLITAISKGGFGGAVGGIAVPLMSLVISPVHAAAIMLPLLCFTDFTGLRAYYGKWDRANLKVMLPGAAFGIGVGTLTFGMVSDDAVRIIVGVVAVLFTLYNVLGWAARQSAANPSLEKGVWWSGLSGFTSFIAHAGGPPLMMFLMPQRLDKITFVATANVFFLVVNAVKVAPYAFLGQFSRDNLLTSLVLAPIVPLGVRLGLWLQGKISHLWFYRVVQTATLLTGVQLIYQGVT